MNPLIEQLIRPHYRQMAGYVSAGMEAGKHAGIIYLNANENPYELPGLEGCNRYPEPQPPALLTAYAQTYEVEEGNIVMTRGADEAIVVLTRLFCEPGEDSVLICPPTFGMYAVNAHGMPVEVVEVPLQPSSNSFALDTSGVIQQARERACKLVYLCSPNNPTGNSLPREDMQRICRELSGTSMVVVDETYIEFAQQHSMSSDLETHPNLVVLRTLSKSYSMAGMRMGCLLCGDTDLVHTIRSKCLDAYPLPRASIDAALRALSPAVRELAQQNINKLLAERERMHAVFSDNPLVRTVYASDANFLLLNMDRAGEFVAYCREHALVLRDFSSKPQTRNCIRVSIGTVEQNDIMCRLLADFTTRHR